MVGILIRVVVVLTKISFLFNKTQSWNKTKVIYGMKYTLLMVAKYALDWQPRGKQGLSCLLEPMLLRLMACPWYISIVQIKAFRPTDQFFQVKCCRVLNTRSNIVHDFCHRLDRWIMHNWASRSWMECKANWCIISIVSVVIFIWKCTLLCSNVCCTAI